MTCGCSEPALEPSEVLQRAEPLEGSGPPEELGPDVPMGGLTEDTSGEGLADDGWEPLDGDVAWDLETAPAAELRSGPPSLWIGRYRKEPLVGAFAVETALHRASIHAPTRASSPTSTRTSDAAATALALFERGADGRPDPHRFTALVFDHNAEGQLVFSVHDRQPKRAPGSCAVMTTAEGATVFGTDVLDNTCTVPPDTLKKRYAHVLTGTYGSDDEGRNDFRIPFTESNGRLRVLFDPLAAPRGFFHYLYGVEKHVLGEARTTEGWMELTPSPIWEAPARNDPAPGRHELFVAVLRRLQLGAPSAPASHVKVERIAGPKASRGTFAVTRRPHVWSGFPGEAWVVDFDAELPASGDQKLVFWSETNNAPVWQLNDQLLLSYEFVELWARDRSTHPGCFEPMSDRLRWRNTVTLVEDNDVRKVLDWRYPLVNPAYQTMTGSLGNVPHATERWTVYPDGTAYRWTTYYPDPKAGLRSEGMDPVAPDAYEMSELIVIAGSRTDPEDHALPGGAPTLRLLDLGGRSRQFRPALDTNAGAWKGESADDWDEVVAIASLRKDVGSAEAGPDVYAVHSNTNRRLTSTGPFHYDVSWHDYAYRFSHWPVGKGAYEYHDKSFALWKGEVSHSSLVSIQVPRGGTEPSPKSWVSLVGLARHGDRRAVLDRAASWLHPADVVTRSTSCATRGFDFAQGAYLLAARGAAPCTARLVPRRRDHRIVQPVFALGGYGRRVDVEVDGRRVEPTRVRQARVGDLLLVRVRGELSGPATFVFRPRR